MNKPNKIHRVLLPLLSWLLFLAGPLIGQSKSEESKSPKPLQNIEHEYASLRPASFDLTDFDLPTVDGKTIKLSEVVRGKKLVLIHYFATFCDNSSYDLVTINELYRQYGKQGFAVIGVCEYSSPKQLQEFIDKHRPNYPIVMEGEGTRDERMKTRHFLYRTKAGDTRAWGTPFNVLIDSKSIQAKGEVIARRMQVAPGELINSEVEPFIRRKIKATPQK